MPKAKRRKNESFEAMFRRFKREMTGSGRKLEVGKSRFFASKPTPNKRKTSALRALEIKEKREYELRSGKIKEEDLYDRHHVGRP
ncbi:MAG: hypothetical protein UY95_C0030G0002 [Parcubacteria group bacterium GW2011_GWA2_56_7]|nr:MAG: hypothetical protein UY95_C0030G0002 [Parcubacteria group bacterium GW2011_GWA2_56_7]